MDRVRIATVWLDGCSGCHMSVLDIDERLLDVAAAIELVYSPLVDSKRFPEDVDVTLVEGAVSSEHDLHTLREIRKCSKVVVALGDCAVTGNVPAMRNAHRTTDLLQRAYMENVSVAGQIPTQDVPLLLPQVHALHELIKVDLHVPGCPPPADLILAALSGLLEGRIPDLGSQARFG